jgi:Zn-dependent protease
MPMVVTFDMALRFALAAIPAIIAITLHEAAHGYAAWALGDDTAKRAGRLSLNPLVHVDRVGTILLPGFLMIFQLLTIHRIAFLFGWAKPVPVAAWKFAHPRRGMMIVAAAGPAMNFFLAWLAALALHLAVELSGTAGMMFVYFAEYFILANLVLGLFNLLPIPPLDGGRIVVGLLPEHLARIWGGFERAGILIVIFLVFLLPRLMEEFDIDFNPVGHALEVAIPWAMRVIFMLAGHDVGSSDAHAI